ncbi:nucleotide pyrophosphohydrolase [Magnetospirillum sp. SS-4]|uniref:nucleotide pyrophosphohydrolase n=1 Tax=Magnetospirillum sp. SS-4 TaxID=2681465 RepID=UPI00138153B5|nr:nucleotide pyrophosphohydrolase [Magnetospirillum sp. SS-4]CAA7625171.1 putative pyrophosphatase [Magnetospirillum sp. SS-4]
MKESDSSPPPSLAGLTERLLAFRDARDWRQFHTVKNLMLSLALEAAEVMELAQWKTDEQVDAALADPVLRHRLEEECADVLLYLLLLAERTGIDLARAAEAKIAVNEARYPIDKSRGNARKYNEL